jgi:hypothetical protein
LYPSFNPEPKTTEERLSHAHRGYASGCALNEAISATQSPHHLLAKDPRAQLFSR